MVAVVFHSIDSDRLCTKVKDTRESLGSEPSLSLWPGSNGSGGGDERASQTTSVVVAVE